MRLTMASVLALAVVDVVAALAANALRDCPGGSTPRTPLRATRCLTRPRRAPEKRIRKVVVVERVRRRRADMDRLGRHPDPAPTPPPRPTPDAATPARPVAARVPQPRHPARCARLSARGLPARSRAARRPHRAGRPARHRPSLHPHPATQRRPPRRTSRRPTAPDHRQRPRRARAHRRARAPPHRPTCTCGRPGRHQPRPPESGRPGARGRTIRVLAPDPAALHRQATLLLAWAAQAAYLHPRAQERACRRPSPPATASSSTGTSADVNPRRQTTHRHRQRPRRSTSTGVGSSRRLVLAPHRRPTRPRTADRPVGSC